MSKPNKQLPKQPLPQPQAKPSIGTDFYKYIFVALALVPIFFCFSAIQKYAVNFPYQDDFDAILRFLCKYKDASGGNKVTLLFSQHGEHRLLHSRIIYVAYYYLFGKINFVHLIYLANLQMLVIYVLFVHFIKKFLPQHWQIASFVAALCLFDLSNGENINFAMCGLANYGVIMLFMLCLFLFTKESKAALAGAVVLEAFTIFSNGNGTIGCLFIVLYLAATKQKKKAMIAGLVFVVCAATYFLTLQHAEALNANESTTPLKIVTYFVYLFGAHYGFDYMYTYSLEFGLASLLAFAVVAVMSRKIALRPEGLALLAICCFFLGSLASVAVFRSNVADIQHLSHSGRYLIYPHFITAIVFVFMVASIQKVAIKQGVMLAVAALMVYAYSYNYECGERGMSIQNKRLHFSDFYYGSRKDADNAVAKKIEAEACAKGIYCISDER